VLLMFVCHGRRPKLIGASTHDSSGRHFQIRGHAPHGERERERGGISNSDQGVLSMGERVEGGRPRGTWMRLWSLWRAQYREEIREEG
jgi:hypothetical protein